MSAYETFGPYHLEREGLRVTDDALKSFWKLRKQDSRPGLDDAVGVYIISVQADDSHEVVPWYVGRTDKQNFQTRFLQHRLRFREILERAAEGQLQIFLIAFLAPSGNRLRKPTTTTKISHNDWLESMLIGSALSRNQNLLNASKVKFLRTMIVPGYLNTPKDQMTKPATALQNMLNQSAKSE